MFKTIICAFQEAVYADIRVTRSVAPECVAVLLSAIVNRVQTLTTSSFPIATMELHRAEELLEEVLRWIRFIFNSLRENALAAKSTVAMYVSGTDSVRLHHSSIVSTCLGDTVLATAEQWISWTITKCCDLLYHLGLSGMASATSLTSVGKALLKRGLVHLLFPLILTMLYHFHSRTRIVFGVVHTRWQVALAPRVKVGQPLLCHRFAEAFLTPSRLAYCSSRFRIIVPYIRGKEVNTCILQIILITILCEPGC